MAPTAAPLSIYQAATLGRTLYESLLELVTEQKIRPELAERVMQQYDQAVADVFDEKNGGGATITCVIPITCTMCVMRITCVIPSRGRSARRLSAHARTCGVVESQSRVRAPLFPTAACPLHCGRETRC